MGKHHTRLRRWIRCSGGGLIPETPKLTVDSGDSVSIETMMHAHDKVKPGTTMDEIVGLRKANLAAGPTP